MLAARIATFPDLNEMGALPPQTCVEDVKSAFSIQPYLDFNLKVAPPKLDSFLLCLPHNALELIQGTLFILLPLVKLALVNCSKVIDFLIPTMSSGDKRIEVYRTIKIELNQALRKRNFQNGRHDENALRNRDHYSNRPSKRQAYE